MNQRDFGPGEGTKLDATQREEARRSRGTKQRLAIEQLLQALEPLSAECALKIALEELPDSKENVRSALTRATRQRGMEVTISADDSFLYIWKTEKK